MTKFHEGDEVSWTQNGEVISTYYGQETSYVNVKLPLAGTVQTIPLTPDQLTLIRRSRHHHRSSTFHVGDVVRNTENVIGQITEILSGGSTGSVKVAWVGSEYQTMTNVYALEILKKASELA